LAYAVIVLGALVSAASVAALAVVFRDFRGTASTTVLAVAGPADRDYSRAA
jgi:hypothetical protein